MLPSLALPQEHPPGHGSHVLLRRAGAGAGQLPPCAPPPVAHRPRRTRHCLWVAACAFIGPTTHPHPIPMHVECSDACSAARAAEVVLLAVFRWRRAHEPPVESHEGKAPDQAGPARMHSTVHRMMQTTRMAAAQACSLPVRFSLGLCHSPSILLGQRLVGRYPRSSPLQPTPACDQRLHIAAIC